jgi:protocatechuate 3,4-dioxygenase beta subunit
VGYRCGATVEQIVGPYYLPDAPLRSDLREEGMPGIALEVAGAVRSTECEPLAGALVEVWQADHTGKYDVRGPTLRGRLEAAGGAYRLSTIFPGRYLNGAQYRPAHIHFRVTAPGFAPLITQLYFEGDPYNEVDPFLHPSLIRAVSDDRALKRVQFDVVLARA